MSGDKPADPAPDRAQQARPLPRRFYKDVSVAGTPGGFAVLLDGRGIKTPAKRTLAVPTRSLAEAVAAEWRAQGAGIDPTTMPLTRLVNTAIDGVTGREAEVRADIVTYAGSDLICYYADVPPELVERQTREWSRAHAWARRELGIELRLAAGVMPVAQEAGTLEHIHRALAARGALELAALHVITTLTGSAILALAHAANALSEHDVWRLAHIDEDFQIERWGEDAEARARRERRWSEMEASARLLALLRT